MVYPGPKNSDPTPLACGSIVVCQGSGVSCTLCSVKPSGQYRTTVMGAIKFNLIKILI